MPNRKKEAPVQVVIGATGGIGSALCERLAASGHRLIVGGRDEERTAALAEKVGAEPFQLDACDTNQVEACVQRAVDLHGQVDLAPSSSPTSSIASTDSLTALAVRPECRAR